MDLKNQNIFPVCYQQVLQKSKLQASYSSCQQDEYKLVGDLEGKVDLLCQQCQQMRKILPQTNKN